MHVSWQVVPEQLPQWLQSQDSRKSEQVMNALLKMTRLDIARLQQVFDS